jgi:hypothetical protein
MKTDYKQTLMVDELTTLFFRQVIPLNIEVATGALNLLWTQVSRMSTSGKKRSQVPASTAKEGSTADHPTSKAPSISRKKIFNVIMILKPWPMIRLHSPNQKGLETSQMSLGDSRIPQGRRGALHHSESPNQWVAKKWCARSKDSKGQICPLLDLRSTWSLQFEKMESAT